MLLALQLLEFDARCKLVTGNVLRYFALKEL